MPLRLNAAMAAAAMLLLTNAAGAATTCTEKTVRDRLAAMLEEFRKPEIRAKLDAASKDLDEDGDFDNDENAQYLAAVASWHAINRNLKGSVESACEVMAKHDALIKSVLGV